MAEIPASLRALVAFHQAVSNSGAEFRKAAAETAFRGNSLAVVQPICSIQEFKRAESLGPVSAARSLERPADSQMKGVRLALRLSVLGAGQAQLDMEFAAATWL